MDSPEPTGMSGCAARIDANGVRTLARMAKLPMRSERAAEQVERLESFLAFADQWEGLGLAFSFEDGEFGYAQSVAQFQPEWDYPTRLNKQRVVLRSDPEDQEI